MSHQHPRYRERARFPSGADRPCAEVEAITLCLAQVFLDTGQPHLAYDNFKTAAAYGNAQACTMLGRLYECGWGIAPDPTCAAIYYERASDADEPWAHFHLAELCLAGRGVQQCDTRACDLFARAARHGHSPAQNMLGMMIEDGRCPMPRHEALGHYRAAAEAGNCWAQFNLARCLIGADAVDSALHWLDRSLRDGHPHYWRAVAPALARHNDPRLRSWAAVAQTKRA